MSFPIADTIKKIIFITDEVKRLDENVAKLIDRAGTLEKRMSDLEKNDAVRAAEAKGLASNISVSAQAAMVHAAADLKTDILARIVRLETVVYRDGGGQLRLPDST